MKKRILVPVDNTPVTQDVIKLADFWGQKLDAKLLFLHARNAEIQKLVDHHFRYCLGFAAGMDSSQDGGFNLNES